MSRSQEELLEEMLRWLKFTGMQEAKDVVDDELTFEDNEEKERDARIVYELTDGEHSQRAIAEHISYSRPTVGNWQKKWAKQGIVDRSSETGRFKHLISLGELGLDCPPIPDPSEESEEEEAEAMIEESEGDESAQAELGEVEEELSADG